MDLARRERITPDRLKAYLVAVGATVAVGAIRFLLHSVLGDVSPFLPFVLAVGVAASYGGLRPGLLATALSAIAAVFLFTPPVFTPWVDTFAEGVGLVLFVVIGASISWLCEAMHRARRRIESQNARLEAEVSERSKAEQAERDQRERLRTTLASIADAVIATDNEGRITDMNAVAESMTGWTSSDAMGQPLDSVFCIVNETTRQAVENPVAKALKEGVIVGLANHTVLIAKDGTERPIDDSAAPIRDTSGKMIGVVLIFRDVTEQRKAAQELRRSEAELADFFENATVGLHWVGADGIILRANRAEFDMLGYSSEEFVGRHIADFHADEDVISDILHRLQSGERLNEYPARLRCKDGSIKDVKIDSSVLFQEGGFVHTRCFTRDVTERKRAEDAQAERSRLTALRADVSTALASAQPTQAGLQGSCEAFVRHLGVYFARIWTHNETDGVLELQASAGRYTHIDGPHSRIKMGEFKIGRIAKSRRPHLTNDVSHDPNISDPAWAERERVVAFAGYPLVVDDRVVGVMAMFACHPLTEGVLTDLTPLAEGVAQYIDRRHAEAGRAEAQRQIATTLESITDGFVRFDRDWRVVYVNAEAERITQRPRRELLGHSHWELFPATVGSKVEAEYRRAVAEQVSVELESFYEPWDRWFSIKGYPSPDGGLSVYFRDITDRKQAEEQLRESEERFRGMFSQTVAGVTQTDLSGRIVLANQRYCEIVGRQSEDVTGLRMQDITHPDDLPRNMPLFQAMVNGGPSFVIEKRYVRPDGSPVWVSNSVSLIRDGDGRPKYVTAVVLDITDRKLAEDGQRLQAERARLLSDVSARLVLRSTDGKRESADELLESVFADVMRHLHAEYYFNFVVGDEPETLRLVSYRGLDSPAAASLGRIRFGDYLCGLVAQTRQPLVVEDLQNCPLENAGAMCAVGVQAYAGYPLLTDGRLIGTISFATARRPRFTAEELELVQAVANLLAAAVERDRLSRVVRESADRLRFIMDSMPQKVFTATPTGDVDYFNPIWMEFTGLAFEQIRDWGWTQFIHPDDVDENLRVWKRSVATGEPFQFEHRFRRLDGEYRWHISRALPMRDGADRIVLWIGSDTDIHDVKQAEQTARFVAEVGAALVELNDPVSTLQKVASMSVPAFTDLCAVDVVEDGDKHRRVAVTHAIPEKLRAYQELMERYPPRPGDNHGIHHVLRSGEPDLVADIPDSLIAAVAHDEEHHQLLRTMGLKSHILVPIRSHGRTVGVLTFITAESGRRYTPADLRVAQDLAHRVAVAIENADLYQALREADRRKDEFLATLAHELRNPLAPIRMGLEMLRLGGDDPATMGEMLDTMERQVGQMVRLIDDLLDVSRITRGRLDLRKTRIELNDVAKTAIESVRPMIEEARHDLLISLPQESLVLDGDPARLSQVFSNLLNNAAKYTPDGGRIVFTARREGSEVAVSIKDGGLGIPEGMLEKVFEMFAQIDRTLDRSHGGLGIGLHLVKKIVELHGGTVGAKSEGEGRGSEFVVRLPLATSSVASRSAPGAFSQPVAQSRRVLVADDNKDAASILARVLTALGHDVNVAYDGKAAVEAAEAYRPDVCLFDIGMPGLNGYEACRAIRLEPWGKQILMVALTGWGQEDDRRRSKEAGFDHHLTKPVEPASLRQLLVGVNR